MELHHKGEIVVWSPAARRWPSSLSPSSIVIATNPGTDIVSSSVVIYSSVIIAVIASLTVHAVRRPQRTGSGEAIVYHLSSTASVHRLPLSPFISSAQRLQTGVEGGGDIYIVSTRLPLSPFVGTAQRLQ